MKAIRNIFKLKKEVKGIKDIVLRNIKNLFEYEKEEENYKIIISNVGKNRILSVEEYLNKIRPYLRDIVNDLNQSDTWKIQLKIKSNFIFPKDDNDQKVIIQKS